MLTIPITKNHVNPTGPVPSINDVIKLCHRFRYQPRVNLGTLEDTANVVLQTSSPARKKNIHRMLVDSKWSFIHEADPRVQGYETFIVLVTL